MISTRNKSEIWKSCNKSPLVLTVVLILTLTICTDETNGKDILFYIGGLSSHSHRAGLEPLAIKLADKGHNVTFFTPLKSKIKHPNITEFCVKELEDAHQKFLLDFGTIGLQSRLQSRFNLDLGKGTALFDYGLGMCEIVLKSSTMKEWIARSHFDMVIFDKSSMSDCAYALAYKFKTKKIISYVAISFLLVWDFDLYGIPAENSWIPNFQSVYETKELSFFDRLHSEYNNLHWYYQYKYYYLPKMDKLTRELLDMPDMPPLENLVKSEALMLANTHFSDSFAKSYPPFVIPIGGMHLKESKGILPNDIANFIEGGNDGFIYISFGSIVTISSLPPKYLKIFFNAIESFDKIKFLWKWEGEFPKNVPRNVLLKNWFPQQDILAHKKIRGFITQGGQVSIQQSIFNGVPLIVLPVNGDQDFNAKRMRTAGNGIELEFFDLTTQILIASINKLLTDKSYTKAALLLSKASKQRPMHPVDLAVWWTEFVLSQDDVSYLKPGSMNNPWWMSRSLDVYAFIFVSLTILIVFLIICTISCFRIVLKRILKDKLIKTKNVKTKSS